MYNDETVRQIFGDSDDEAEPFEGFRGVDVHFKMPQNFEENWTKELPNVFDRLVREDSRGQIILLILTIFNCL